jgi:molybdopterin synthase catalytic subunit
MKRTVTLSDQRLDVANAFAAVAHPSAGAVDLFVGTTRETSHGRRVIRLAYEAYEPMAVQMMERLVDEAARRWPLCGVAVMHRTGDVPVGETSVVIAASAPHRAEAFEACRFLIDRLKQDVPIWKHEFFADGSSEWTGTPSPHQQRMRT